MLEDGAPHLKAQLAHENVRLMLLNGRQVIDEVQRLGLVDLREHGGIRFRDRTCRLYTGVGGGLRWAAWSTNLQSNWGVSAAFKQELGAWLADIGQPRVDPGAPSDGEPVATINTLGHLSPAMSISGKSELVEVLTRWLGTSSAVTIGDIQKFAGKPWLTIQLGQQRVALNADTKRTAVETFLRESADEPERPWRVIANLRGRINKVVPGAPLPGWYAYLDHPLDEESTI